MQQTRDHLGEDGGGGVDQHRRPLRIACLVGGGGSTVLNLAERIERGDIPAQIVLVAATKPGVPAIDRARSLGLPTAVIAVETPRSGGAAAPELRSAGGPSSSGDRPDSGHAPGRADRPGQGRRPGWSARSSADGPGEGPRSRRPPRTRAHAGRDPEPMQATPAGAIDDALDAALRSVRPDLICLCGYLRLFRVGAWSGRVINLHPGPLPQFGGKGMYGRRVHRAVLEAGLHETRCCVHAVDEIYDHGPVIAERRVPVLPADTPESLEQRVRQAERELLPDVVRRIALGQIPLPLSEGPSIPRPPRLS